MVRTGSGLLAAAVIAATLTGCGSGGVTDATNRVDAKNGIDLISAGSGDKAPLRLTAKQGATEKLTMAMDMTLTLGSGSSARTVSLPTMSMGMDVTVDKVAHGLIDSSFRYVDVKVDSTDPSYASLQKSIQALAGITGTVQRDSRGAVTKSELKLPDSLDSTLSSLLTSLKSQMDDLSVPFPDEPVGVGARWTYTRHLTLAGIASDVVMTYELLEHDGNHVVLGTSIEQKAPAQNPTIPGMPAGATVHLVKQETSGTGRNTLDLAYPVPVGYTSDGTTDAKMTVKAQGQSQDLDEHLAVKVRLTRR